MVRVLSKETVSELVNLEEMLTVIHQALVKQVRGEVVRPERPHFPVGTGLDSDRPTEPLGMGLTMPAYIHGADYYATKLVGFYEENPDRGLPTINAQIVLTDAETGLPLSFMDGTHVTSARTGCVGGIATRALAVDPVRVGVFGAGTQARWQVRAIAAATEVESVRVFSPSDSKYDCAADLDNELDVNVSAVDSPEETVAEATVVVCATTSTSPVFPGHVLDPGTLVVGVGSFRSDMQELDRRTFERATRVFADVPEEVAETGDFLSSNLNESDLVPFGRVLEEAIGRESVDEIIVVESVGSAVFDAAAAATVYDLAVEEGVGKTIDL